MFGLLFCCSYCSFSVNVAYSVFLITFSAQKKLSAKEIEEIVKGERKVPLVIDFYATWCGPCILMAQELEMVRFSLALNQKSNFEINEDVNIFT